MRPSGFAAKSRASKDAESITCGERIPQTSMAPGHLLPFKVGEEAESRSFVTGFRGAWFRCKINKLSQTKDLIKALLEFYDYPGEKMHWTQLYQKPKGFIRSMDEGKQQLILRPCFPPWYRENEMPDLCGISDSIVIVDDVWKVGDLVDWWSDGCYWSGRVTSLLGKDKVQVGLQGPPLGEGKSYEAFCKDLRPSLDWSLEHGWTVPESETSHCCARLVQPLDKDNGGNENCTLASNTTVFSSCDIKSSISSTTLAAPLLPLKDNEQDNYKLVEFGGGCGSCETGTSVSYSALASSLLSPSGCIDPRANEASMLSSAREDNEKETEVQSSKMSLDSDDGTKEIAKSFCKVSSRSTISLVPPSGCINPGVIKAFTQSGGEETEEEIEVQSVDINVSLDDCRRVTTKLGKALSTCAVSSIPQTGYMTPEPGTEESEQGMEIQSTNMIMDSDYSGRGITIMLDEASRTPACTLLTSTICINTETNERFGHGSGREETEQEVVQSTSMKFDSDCGRTGATSTSDMVSSKFAASFMPSVVNETCRSGTWREETEREIQSTMNLYSDDCRKETTSTSETSRQRSRREEKKNIEVHSTDMNMDSGADRREVINRTNQTPGISSVSLLPPIGMEEAEQGIVIQPTSMNLESEDVGRKTTVRFDKSSITPGTLFLPGGCNSPETNDTSMQILGLTKTEKNVVKSMNIILDSEDRRKQITNFLDKDLGSHEMQSPLHVAKVSCGNDQYNFRQLPKRLRITENHHATSVTEMNSMESSIMELEELANKIKWLKGLIIFGLQWSNAMKPSWRFSET